MIEVLLCSIGISSGVLIVAMSVHAGNNTGVLIGLAILGGTVGLIVSMIQNLRVKK